MSSGQASVRSQRAGVAFRSSRLDRVVSASFLRPNSRMQLMHGSARPTLRENSSEPALVEVARCPPAAFATVPLASVFLGSEPE